MGYIESGKGDGAKVHLGGGRAGTEGFFIEPTIFVNAKPEMKIVREESLLGLYKGYLPSLYKAAAVTALNFAFFEFAVSHWH